jgi:predicted nuclease of predicted toxin-antitoxin system
VTRRLLFDQNLSPRLVRQIAAEFPGSLHVRDLDLHAATDAEVLRIAAERDLVVVTKDKDFADIVTARNDGPKVLWLMLGNVSTDEIAESILAAAEPISRLLDDPSVHVVQMASGVKPLE